jgi:hypothetical protein
MDMNHLISAVIGAVIALVGLLAKNRLLRSQSHHTDIETELSITSSWKEFAENQQAVVARLEGRLEEIEKSADFWREKHIASLTNYEELKVKHSTLVSRVNHLEEENAQLVWLLSDLGVTLRTTDLDGVVLDDVKAKNPPRKKTAKASRKPKKK